MIPVLYEDNHLLVVEKPVNMPVQADTSEDADVLSALKQYLKDRYSKPGNVYLGLVHRLDRPVGGVMVFARTSKAASRLSESVRNRQMEKEYLAVLDGVCKTEEGRLEDWLGKNTRENTAYVTDREHGKYAALSYRVLAVRDHKTLVRIRLETGRPHQIRIQFASRGLPLVHDQRYNKNASKGQIALYACRLTFPHPLKKEEVSFSHLPPAKYPWNLFDIEL